MWGAQFYAGLHNNVSWLDAGTTHFDIKTIYYLEAHETINAMITIDVITCPNGTSCQLKL